MRATDYIDEDVIRELFPEAQIEIDNDGQIIIYTNEWVGIEDMLDTRNQERDVNNLPPAK